MMLVGVAPIPYKVQVMGQAQAHGFIQAPVQLSLAEASPLPEVVLRLCLWLQLQRPQLLLLPLLDDLAPELIEQLLAEVWDLSRSAGLRRVHNGLPILSDGEDCVDHEKPLVGSEI